VGAARAEADAPEAVAVRVVAAARRLVAVVERPAGAEAVPDISLPEAEREPAAIPVARR